MSGTYRGTYGGGNDFGPKDQSLGYIFAVNDGLQAQAAINGIAAMGVSQAELSRAVYGGGPAVGVAPTPAVAGPARAASGTPSGGAAGSPGVVTAGRGSVGTGAGTRGVSASGRAGSGSGHGGVLTFGSHLLPMKSADKVSVQPLTVGGYDVPVDRGWSDAGDFEQRYGDSEVLSTLYGTTLLLVDGLTWLRQTPVGQAIDDFPQKQLLQPPTDIDKYSPAYGGGFYSE